MIEYLPVSNEHVSHLVSNMRELDQKELIATVNWSFERILTHSVKTSVRSASVVIDGELVCIMGVTVKSMLGGEGCPWLIGTNKLNKHKKALVSESVRLLPEVMGGFERLENFVHSENKPAIRYLKYLGFTLHSPEPYGCKGEMFHKFEMVKA